MTALGTTDLDVHPLCLGGSVFGWTADEAASFAVLDAYLEAGGNFVDTADSYSAWIDGNRGGESEEIIGRWLARRGVRDRIVLGTKVGFQPGAEGLSPANVRRSLEGSLRRLGTDRVDLYWAHTDDPDTPLEETLGAFDELVRAGSVRYVGASNISAPRLAEALATSDREGLVRYVALQPHYNLVERGAYEDELRAVCEREGLACLPYWSLAQGFLTGKYRAGAIPAGDRAEAASAYLDARGERVLAALEAVAGAHATTMPAVALAWLLAQPTVAATVASARTPEQLAAILPMASLELSADELAALTAASER